jgi:protein ImuA
MNAPHRRTPGAVDFTAERADSDGLQALRRAIRTLEGFSDDGSEGQAVTFGIATIDAALGGGLVCGALHEIAAAHETEIATATGFALGLAGRLTALRAVGPSPGGRGEKSDRIPRHVVWLIEDMALVESGAPYGPGLDEAGLAPERLITVAAVSERDMLWAMEEALRCRAIAAVIGETRSRRIDPVATRRLSLAAAGSGAFAVLLRATPGEEHSAAATRWIVGAAPGASGPYGLGPPHLRVHLVRNRRGPLGSWTLEFNRACFTLATHPQPVAGTAFDRSYRADVA